MKKNRTFRKKRGANNGRLNRHINSTHKMKGGMGMPAIFGRFRRQPPHSDEVPPGVPPPPSQVLGGIKYIQIHRDFPLISKNHYQKLVDRSEDYEQQLTPSDLFLKDVNSLADRIDQTNSRFEQITKNKTMSETKRAEITREYKGDILKAMNKWLISGDFDDTSKQIKDALRTAFRNVELAEQRDEVDVHIQPGNGFDNDSLDVEEIKPLSSSRWSPQTWRSLPPSRTNSRAKRREKWERDWRIITAFPGTIIYPNKKA